MKTALTLSIVLVLILGTVVWIQWRSASLSQRDRNLEAKEFKKQQDERLAKITQRDSEIQALLNERRDDSVRQAKKESTLISRISGLKSKLATSSNRLPVIQDTIIQAQDSLITVIQNSRDTLYITDNKVIDSLQHSNLEISELFKDQLKESIKLSGELQREKKKKWIVGPTAGVNYRGEPTVSFGVTYKLFSF